MSFRLQKFFQFIRFPLAVLLLGLVAACSNAVVNPTVLAAAETQPPQAEAAVAPTIKRETRALWSWAGRRARARADVDALVAQVDSANLNVVLLQIYRDGTAFFTSSPTRFPDRTQRLPNQSLFVDDEYRDALSYLLSIRDQRRADKDPLNDFEVHVWFAVHSGGKVRENASNPQPDATEPYMLHGLFPEFKLKIGDYYRNNDERYTNHAVSVVQQPRFRAYMSDLIAGVVEDYKVDGVHLDFIRTGGICFNNEALDYPGTAYDYPGCQEDYKAWTLKTYGRAYTLWEDTNGSRQIQDGDSGRVAAWLRHSVDLLVKSIHDEVRAVDPKVIISVAAVITVPGNDNERQTTNGQAAWVWLDRGWIDVAFPTFYSTNAQTIARRVDLFQQAVKDEQARARIFPGLAIHDIAREKSRPPSIMVDQVEVLVARGREPQAAPQVRGVAFFRDGFLTDDVVKTLVEGPFREPALPFWGK